MTRRPQDFQVREISADGAVVALSEQRDRVPTHAERQAALQEMLDKAASAPAKQERLTFAEPSGGWREALDELVGQDSALLIQRVAHGESPEHVVAAPEGFRDRVYLQVCIQVRLETWGSMHAHVPGAWLTGAVSARTASRALTADCGRARTVGPRRRSSSRWTQCAGSSWTAA